ncbi:MAG TPA: MMPL family transporter [Solirubrobacteraceae bacterium]|nr:MMPL family transporter [Solirubrobacteraceae bacterium]
MLRLARLCIAHRRLVVIAWVVLAVATTAIAGAVGRHYATNFTLPGTDTQRAADLLKQEFHAQSGDVDTVVFHVSHATIDAANVRQAITPVLARAAGLPHVTGVISPYTQQGAVQVSRDRTTAFATINFDKSANLLPNDTGRPLLDAVSAIHVPGLQVAAGGQVVEQAEGFSVGPATTVGVIAALVILLLTFGSLTAAGMPLVTAGFGLITGVALIGLGTHVTDMSNVSPELALMIGLGVGIDYALFIVTRFRENYAALGDVEEAVVEAMDTSGRAILLAGTTVVIALLGMFATGVSFMYGLAIASVLAVVFTLAASLTVLPALLSRFGARLVRPRRGRRGSPAPATPGAEAAARRRSTGWRRWSETVQARPRPLAIVSLAVMVALLLPVVAMRMDTSDAGNDPANLSSRHAFDLLAAGFGPGFNGPLLVVAELHGRNPATVLPAVRAAVGRTPDVVAVTAPRVAPSGTVAVMEAYPGSAPQALATTDLVNRLRDDVLPPVERTSGTQVLVGGFTAGSIDFSSVLSNKLPVFIGIVVILSALLLLVIFRSVVIPVQAALMNLLSIGGALGVTVAVFQWGWLGGLLGVEPGPIEPWIPVLMFAVVFGLSMDYEVFLVSRVREEWVRRGDASAAVADGIAFTGRVISAAAAIMVCVFLSFMLGNERTIKEFGFGLAAAVFLDALVVRCVLLPAVLELLGPTTWRLPGWLDARLPHINIEGSTARGEARPAPGELTADELEPAGQT